MSASDNIKMDISELTKDIGEITRLEEINENKKSIINENFTYITDKLKIRCSLSGKAYWKIKEIENNYFQRKTKIKQQILKKRVKELEKTLKKEFDKRINIEKKQGKRKELEKRITVLEKEKSPTQLCNQDEKI